MSEPIDLKNLIRAGDLAEQLGIHLHCVYRWVSEGRLRAVKLGRRLYFERDQVQQLFERVDHSPPAKLERRPRTSKWAERTLERFGLGRPKTTGTEPKESPS